MIRLAALLLLVFGAYAFAEGYDYPYTDPYLATVMGTPDSLRADVPETIPLKIRKLPRVRRDARSRTRSGMARSSTTRTRYRRVPRR